ncbi:arylsulfatase [Thalassoroseus pseudoceratinae]|uniref:arylsulfatase n=1 Tax=Thalassoroseus pseudoceratinae TaxID=2713176 RepID=UPI0014222967|nr:arylsulfatase [Thalassoroseus pseudoceratinae]
MLDLQNSRFANRHQVVQSIVWTILLLIAATASVQAEDRPNIIVILSDDMGYSDLGCYGGEIETPTLDGLAREGLRFTQFYNTGRCCPTRASLLTGLYPHQAGVGHMMNDRGTDGYRGNLNNRCRTMAEVLKPSGYATYGVGKWHVTLHTDPEGPKHNWPLQRGFDRFYGTITGAGSFFDPGTLTRDNTMVSPFADPEYQPEQYYYTDAISDHAARFITEHSSTDGKRSPFFMYVAYTAAHWPMHALPEDIAKYRGKFDQGYEAYRQGRLERLRKLGLIDAAWEMSPTVGNWEQVQHSEWEQRCMEVYAAMIDRMDQGIGQIVNTLKQQGQFENTLIFFMQDNGGCQEGVGRRGDWKRPVAPSLPKIAQDAIRLDVIPKQNRAGVPTLQGPHIMPGPEDTYIAYGIDWANVSNTPFREYKHFVHEGGISTPLIVHWPNGISRRGELEHQPGHLIDIMATCVDVANADYPDKHNGQDIKPLEGVSLRPTFEGGKISRSGPIFWEHEGNRAIRDGKWKLVAKKSRDWELYDLEKDRTELHDLSDDHPELVKQLADQWETYAKRANVLPLSGRDDKPKFNKKKKRYQLKADANLPRSKSPFVENRPFTVTVKISELGSDGVLVAQGGSSAGYAVYVQDGRLHFAVRRSGKLDDLVSTEVLPPDAKTITVSLADDGVVNATVNRKPFMKGKSAGVLTQMPLDGLQVGKDLTGAVGNYETPFEYSGTIERVILTFP